MRFRDLFSKRSLTQLLFAVAIVLLMIVFAVIDSHNQVQVKFNDTDFTVQSDKYTLRVAYSDIGTATLTELEEPGVKVSDAYDDDSLRAGCWRNGIWGEYHICADLDSSVCVVLTLSDGQIYVFTGKDSNDTAAYFETLQQHLQ